LEGFSERGIVGEVCQNLGVDNIEAEVRDQQEQDLLQAENPAVFNPFG
jgi:hypothetical protein